MAHIYYVQIKGKTQGVLKGDDEKLPGAQKEFFRCIALKMGSFVAYDPMVGVTKSNRQHEPVVLTKEWGPQSPQILQACWTSEPVDVTIKVESHATGEPKKVETITLEKAYVTSVKRYTHKAATSTDQYDLDPLEDVSISFGGISIDGETKAKDVWNKA